MRDIVDATQGLELRPAWTRGVVFVGNSDPARRTYTVMGDAVNLAARRGSGRTPGNGREPSGPGAMPVEACTHALEPFLVKGKEAMIDAAIVHEVTDEAVDKSIGPFPHRP